MTSASQGSSFLKCHNCLPCKTADETEKILLREEAKQAGIEASVQLESVNKRFMCKLPLRGKPEDQLAASREGPGQAGPAVGE